MNFRITLIVIAVACCILTLPVTAQKSHSNKFSAVVSKRPGQRQQPFGGEIRFLNSPAIMKSCSLKVSLTCHEQVSGSRIFRLTKSESFAMEITPDSIVWEAPIDSGATKTTIFVYSPTMVGCFGLNLAERWPNGWHTLTGLKFDINEDGKTLCSGPPEQCVNTPVPPHPRHTDRPVIVEFPINPEISTRLQDRHFSGVFKFDPADTLTDSTVVDFLLECHVGMYSEVQFLVEHSSNISLSSLPESWGDKAGPAPGYRLFNGRFTFRTLKPGLTQLTFKLVGKHPTARSGDRITTDFPMYLVIGNAGELLFAGSFNPYTRYKKAGDPMLGSLTSLLDVTNRDFRTRTILSQPDFRGQETDARDGTDTSQADSTK